MANEVDLDLDAIAPSSKKVKLGGNIYEVNPPKFNNLVSLMKLVGKLQAGGDGQTELIGDLKNQLIPMIPALADDNVDLTMEQLGVLMNFVLTISTPKNQEALEKEGYTVGQIVEKKNQTELSESSATSSESITTP